MVFYTHRGTSERHHSDKPLGNHPTSGWDHIASYYKLLSLDMLKARVPIFIYPWILLMYETTELWQYNIKTSSKFSRKVIIFLNIYINKHRNSSTMVCMVQGIKQNILIHMATVLNHQKIIKTSETKAGYNYK